MRQHAETSLSLNRCFEVVATAIWEVGGGCPEPAIRGLQWKSAGGERFVEAPSSHDEIDGLWKRELCRVEAPTLNCEIGR